MFEDFRVTGLPHSQHGLDGHEHVKRHGLLPHVSPDRLVAHYGVLSYWTSGAFADDELVDRVVDDDLMLLAGATRGMSAREVRGWREEVAADGPRWREMRRIAAAEAVSVKVG